MKELKHFTRLYDGIDVISTLRQLIKSTEDSKEVNEKLVNILNLYESVVYYVKDVSSLRTFLSNLVSDNIIVENHLKDSLEILINEANDTIDEYEKAVESFQKSCNHIHVKVFEPYHGSGTFVYCALCGKKIE